MNLGSVETGFFAQAIFLLPGDVKKAASDRSYQNQRTKPHVDEGHGQRAKDKTCQQAADAPVDKLSFETFKYKGLLEPLIYCESFGH